MSQNLKRPVIIILLGTLAFIFIATVICYLVLKNEAATVTPDSTVTIQLSETKAEQAVYDSSSM